MKSTTTNKLLRNVTRSVRGARRRALFARATRNIVPGMLGALGLVVMSGLAAMMIFSPRTRYRALGAAKNAYGRVSNRIGHTRLGERIGVGQEEHEQPTEGEVGRIGQSSSGYAATGI